MTYTITYDPRHDMFAVSGDGMTWARVATLPQATKIVADLEAFDAEFARELALLDTSPGGQPIEA
jgi:hypothetical protein